MAYFVAFIGIADTTARYGVDPMVIDSNDLPRNSMIRATEPVETRAEAEVQLLNMIGAR